MPIECSIRRVVFRSVSGHDVFHKLNSLQRIVYKHKYDFFPSNYSFPKSVVTTISPPSNTSFCLFVPTWPWPDYNKVSTTSYLQHMCCFLLSFKNLPNLLYFFQLYESWSDQQWRETTHVVLSAAVPSVHAPLSFGQSSSVSSQVCGSESSVSWSSLKGYKGNTNHFRMWSPALRKDYSNFSCGHSANIHCRTAIHQVQCKYQTQRWTDSSTASWCGGRGGASIISILLPQILWPHH